MEKESEAGSDHLEKKILRRLPYEILGLAGLLALATAIIFDPISAFLCLVGGIVSCLSFLWIKRAVILYLGTQKKRSLQRLIIFQLLRLGLIGFIFLIIIYFFSSRVLAFMAGFSALLLAMAGEAISSIWKKSWKT
ncbi:MAG: ATP synthase subunit I [Candidatus Aminicenantes bacterium]|nr:ATP synthase subunit I [Candidatus Aminicenantes bacterium]